MRRKPGESLDDECAVKNGGWSVRVCSIWVGDLVQIKENMNKVQYHSDFEKT